MPIFILFLFSFLNLSAQIAKNTIYFIADGMGPNSLTAARIYSQGSSGKLNFERFSNIGMAKTYSSDDYVTDSAAAATALASGVKTYNGSIGLSDPKLEPKKQSRDLETILDVAVKAGKSIGIITTTRVTHATPACFYAHVKDRDMEEEIALQLPLSSLTFLLGGGRNQFLNNKINPKLMENLKTSGWTYVDNAEALNNIDRNQKNLKVLGLFNASHLTYEKNRSGIKDISRLEPTLSQMLFWGIKTLETNPKGYLLVVEAGRIDHAGHENNLKLQLSETLALDEAYKMAFEKAGPQTLIVSTSDHETGGLSLNGYAGLKEVKGDALFELKKQQLVAWSTGPGAQANDAGKLAPEKSLYYEESASHTASDVLVFASGPMSNLFSGYQENIEIPHKILKAMGLKFSSKVNEENYKASKKL